MPSCRRALVRRIAAILAAAPLATLFPTIAAAQTSGADATSAPPGGSEGYYRLNEATDLFLRAPGDEIDAFAALHETTDDARKKRRQYVRRKAAALNLARAALRLPYRNPPPRSGETISPLIGGFRALARGFLLESRVNAEDGKLLRASSSGADAVELGMQILRGGVITNAFIGFSCESIGRRSLWELADKLDAKTARAVLRRLETLEVNRAPLTETLTEEKRAARIAARDDMTAEMNRFHAAANDPAPPIPDDPESSPPGPLPTPDDIEALLQRNDEVWDVLLAASAKPLTLRLYPDAAAKIAPYAGIPALEGWDALISAPFLLHMVRLSDVTTRAEASLLIAALALRAYNDRFGDYPATLRDLAAPDPDHNGERLLVRSPIDPFAPLSAGFAPVCYRRLSAGAYLLYSVGPDGKDDDGKPLRSEGELTDAATAARNKVPPIRNVLVHQRGDIVVGINVGPDSLSPAAPQGEK